MPHNARRCLLVLTSPQLDQAPDQNRAEQILYPLQSTWRCNIKICKNVVSEITAVCRAHSLEGLETQPSLCIISRKRSGPVCHETVLTNLTLTDCSRGSELRQASRWGLIPKLRSTATLCCVGLVFCSPTTPSTGTKLTCTLQKLPAPTLNWNCLHDEFDEVIHRMSTLAQFQDARFLGSCAAAVRSSFSRCLQATCSHRHQLLAPDGADQ